MVAGRNARDGEWSDTLAGVITEATVRLDVPAADWREAVRAAGGLLAAAGAVAPEYVEAMVRTVEELGPYAVISPGIALPHARPADGARRAGLSLVRLRPPVAFNHPHNDPVDLVFGLSAVDSESHVAVLAALAELLSDPASVAAIRAAATAADVVSVCSTACGGRR